MMIRGPQIELFYFDAGGGHRSAVEALQCVLGKEQPDWCLQPVHLQELLAPIDPLSRSHKSDRRTGLQSSEDFYNRYMKSGLTYGSRAMLRGLQYGISLLSPLIEEKLRSRWQTCRPELVVSLIPNFNRPMFRALRDIYQDVPYVTIMTDLLDCPPHFWQEKQEQYLICPTPEATVQARSLGYQIGASVFEVSGTILHPRFYRSKTLPGALLRSDIGLASDLPTALISFGGYPATRQVMQVLDALAADAKRVQTVVMCAGNEMLQRTLQNRPLCYAAPHTRDLPQGQDMPAFMDLCDFVIGKPGPGIIAESVKRGKPILVERSRRTMIQELENTFWIERHGVGAVVDSLKDVGKVIERAVRQGDVTLWTQNCLKIDNQGVFDVVNILQRLMAKSACESGECTETTLVSVAERRS